MAPSVQKLLASALLLALASFARGQQQNQRHNAAPFVPPATSNGAIPSAVVGQQHLMVANDLKNSLNLRYPADFVKESLADYQFQNPNILLKALLHPSYKARDRKGASDSFEPLDYVGGFVLDYVVSRYILMNSANKSQHAMSHAKVAVLRQDSLAYFAIKNNFHKNVFLDRPIEKTSLREFADGLRNVHTLADLKHAKKKRSFVYKIFKAVAGAIFVDSGFNIQSVEPVFLKMIKRDLDLVLKT